MKKLHLILLLFATISLSAQKNVLVEELTGTWCQYCPGGIYVGDSLCETYDNVFFVAIHTNDIMANEEYASATNLIAAPTANIGRHFSRIDVENWFSKVQTEMGTTPSASISVSNNYNTNSRVLTTTVSATALENMSGSYRFAAIVVEDGIHGYSASYNQANIYSGASNYVGGFESMPNPVPYERMAYDHVGRYLMGGYDGAENSFPTSLNAGQSASYEFSYTLPENYNHEYVKVIGVLINSNGTINNAGCSNYLDGNENAAPFFTSLGKEEAFTGTTYNCNVYAHDPDNKELSITATTLPSWLTFEQNDNKSALLSGTPTVEGDYEVVLQVTDGERTSQQSFTITVGTQLDGEWKYVGQPGFNGAESYVHDMVFYGDICYVLVQENNTAKVYKSVNDGEWEQVGNIGFGMTYVQSTIDVASNGDVYIGFAEDGPDWTFIGHIMKWDGTTWIDLNAPSASYDIFLRLDNEDTPYYVSSTDQTWLGYVRKYVNGEWVEVGGGSIQPTYTMFYGLDFDSENVPHIQWAAGNNKIHVSKIVDNQFVEYGEYVSYTAAYYYTSFAINDNDQMFVAMSNAGTRCIDVFTYQNEEWVKIGENIGNTTSTHMDMALKDGYPVIVYADVTMSNSLSIMQYDGENWNYVGQRAFTDGATSYPQVALRDGTVYTAFIENDLGTSVSVMKYDQNTTSVIENQFVKTSKINCYPTIASSELNIESEIEGEAMVYNTNGVCVKTFILKNGQNKLEINDLPNGFYIINLKGEKAYFIVK